MLVASRAGLMVLTPLHHDLFFSMLMGITVLLLKTHYSLDVAGAFLVTYAPYRLQRRWLEPMVRRAARS